MPHFGGARAHDAADARRGLVVDDEDVAWVQLAFDVVQGDDRLPRLGEPDDETTGDSAAVIGVHGMAEFEHDVVRHINGGRDRPDATEQESPLHPPRRHRGRIDAGHRAESETLNPCPGLNRQRQGLALCGQGRHVGGVDVVEIVGAGDFAGQPAHRQAVATVRGDRQMKHHIVESEDRDGVVTGFRGSRR